MSHVWFFQLQYKSLNRMNYFCLPQRGCLIDNTLSLDRASSVEIDAPEHMEKEKAGGGGEIALLNIDASGTREAEAGGSPQVWGQLGYKQL